MRLAMRRGLFSLAVLMGLMAASAWAEPLVIATGRDGGGYDRRAEDLVLRLQSRGIEAEVLNLSGSNAISLQVCNGSAEIGIMQIDAIWARRLEGCNLTPIGPFSTTTEAAFLLVPPGSRIDELSDLGAGNTISVDRVDSGTELFWRTIVRIEKEHGQNDDWASAQTANVAPEGLNTQASFGTIDAAVLVRRPTDPAIQDLLSLGWSIVEFWDRDINDLTFNNRPLYTPVRVDLQIRDGYRVRGWVYELQSFIAVKEGAFSGEVFDSLVLASQL